MISANIIRLGKADSPQEKTALKAGPLSLFFQEGEISKIFFGNAEAVQRIYARVRDQNWGTVPNQLSALNIQKSEHSFAISFHVDSIQDDIDFRWDGAIIGSANGVIEFSFKGEAHSDFLTSRIGFCILHPLATCMDKSCVIIGQNGKSHTGVFPRLIAPAEIVPFLDMTSMEYETCPGIRIKLTFSGDLFEMEDQRNWSDASYKTFCTPLRLECPRLITAGSKVEQKVTLELLADNPGGFTTTIHPTQEPVSIILKQENSKALPGLGLGSSARTHPYSEREIHLLKKLNLSHHRVDLHFSSAANEELIQFQLENAMKPGLPLEIALYLQDAKRDASAALKWTKEIGCPIKRWIIFEDGKYVSTPSGISTFKKLAEKGNPAPIGGGSDADFYELNSQSATFNLMDFVSYSLNPQVHSADELSLIENLEAQAMTVESARHISNHKPVIISPITLKQRFNPVAVTKDAEGKADELPPNVDPRQMSLFAAGWTIGSLLYLLRSPVESLTYYETVGWRGVMEEDGGCPLPDKFHSLPGSVFPIYHVFADLGEFRNGQVIETKSSNPMTVACLGIRENDRTLILLANLSQESQSIHVEGLGGQAVLRIMDEQNTMAAMTDPVEFRSGDHDHHLSGNLLQFQLRPYAIGRLVFY